jgi:hypothetical protein
VQFAHKTGAQVAHLVSVDALPKGRLKLKFEYVYNGALLPNQNARTESIFINDKKAGERSFTKAQSHISGGKTDGRNFISGNLRYIKI